ncbi:MAG: transglutaminase family protein [Hyphomicrobium sp.]|nr:transglutaminase family protein [Hyphomicrobium sp.]
MIVRYLIRQTSSYAYEGSVPFARHLLRMLPADRRLQKVIRSELSISPEPSELVSETDFFGNKVAHVVVREPHHVLVVEQTSEVELIDREPTVPSTTPSVATIRAMATSSARIDGKGPAHHLYPSRIVRLVFAATDYAATSCPDDRPILEAAIDLARRIHDDFAYDPIATDVSTPIEEVLENRRGVCQDFAHVMIAGLRGLGLPAAYVSGYLRTEPPIGEARLVGADAMHAWVAVWCGEGVGWRGVDPTNAIVTLRDHVEVAFGRDYADVSPLDGIILSSGRQSLSVAVDVAPLE